MSLEAGSHIGHYRLERRLGTGGMGAVYLARDTHLDRLVAIKLLVAPTEEGRRRLLREARAVAKLDHPGICAVHEVGHDPAAGDFIAMQYVEGETLEARIRRGRPRPDETLAIAGYIAEALIAAHRHGIVHRDLKPGNVIITPSGAPKLLDFGLATHVAGSAGAASALTATQVTDPGVVVGTPVYMSPEQVRNETADVRSDVFSLGAVIYECLTGRRPFGGSTNAEIMGEVLHVDPPPVSSVVSEIGPAHDTLCARLLAKRPAERFQSAEEVLGAIRTLVPSTRLVTTGIAAPPAPRWSRARVSAIAAAVVVIAGLGWWMWSKSGSLPAPSPEALTWYLRGEESMRDGTYVSARDQFTQATKLSSQFVMASARLAEAQTALDDERNAQATLLEISTEVPRLGAEEKLRYEAAMNATLQRHPAAIAAYQRLAELKSSDAGRWLDLGRALENAERRADAIQAYQKAATTDPQYAAAHLRLGILRSRRRESVADGLAAIDEAIRLYKLSHRPEGEALATLRKAVALSVSGQFADARTLAEKVLAFAQDQAYVGLRVQALVELARIETFAGKGPEAEALARRAVSEATAAGLQTFAAGGFLELANSLFNRSDWSGADAQVEKGLDLAVSRGARRLEMRLRLTQASIRLQTSQPQQALDLAAAPLQYFKDHGDFRLSNTAMDICSRAHESLDQHEDAWRLTAEALRLAEAEKQDPLIAQSLESLAGQLTRIGRHPEALVHRERIDRIHRALVDERSLPFDLANHAELLITMGRLGDADRLLDELETAIAAKKPGYAGRATRALMLRAVMASVEDKFADGQRAAAEVAKRSKEPGTSPNTVLFARVLEEHAAAQLGKPRSTPDAVISWLDTATSPAERRELTYWIARILVARREFARAYGLVSDALQLPAARANPELAWRLAAVGVLAARGAPKTLDGASIAALAQTYASQVRQTWAGAADTCNFKRPDLLLLHRSLD